MIFSFLKSTSFHGWRTTLVFAGAALTGWTTASAADAGDNSKTLTVADYGRIALVQDGDATRGQKIFNDEQSVACVKCHTIDGQGTKTGPSLFAVGDRFSRRDLIDAVLTPSAVIADGYSTVVVETQSGEEYQGTLKQVTNAGIELMGADGQVLRIAATDIKERHGSALSLMPEGLQAGLSGEQFTDLIEYLVRLKDSAHAETTIHGMPDTIPSLPTPLALRPLFEENLQAPPASLKAAGQNTSGLVWLGQIPGFPNRFLLAHQTGVLWLLEKKEGGAKISVFVDLTPEVFCARGPNGLLGLAFHPQFRENRRYYLKHQVLENGQITTVLAERQAAPDCRTDSGRPSRQLLKITSVAEHHNGGCLQFGPDGFLYFGMGDSAPNGDPQGYGQDLRLLLGKMLRLDVDHRDPGLEYAIPADNPFRGRADARPEIWAYGLREPWRFSFDPLNGDLWVADLGQERGDEVAIVRRGENHGWNVYEGFEIFSNAQRRDTESYVAPIFASRRKHGSAVMGGYVYRGDPRSSFYGVYIFGDHQSRRIWGMTQDHGSLQTIRHLATASQSITCFAPDEAGNLYVVGYQGMVYQLDLGGAHFEKTVEPSTTKSSSGSGLKSFSRRENALVSEQRRDQSGATLSNPMPLVIP